jgi:arsenite-transporting ATPase
MIAALIYTCLFFIANEVYAFSHHRNLFRRKLIYSATSKPFTDLLEAGPVNPKYLFIGGKGGVGKTTSSASIAVKLSDAGFKTLIVSTDPAHSLGDALDVTLSSGQVTPITTETNLWALEVDVEEAMEEFKLVVKGLDAESLSESLGIPKDLIASLGLEELASIFTNPPPGIDEIVALSKVFGLENDGQGTGGRTFDRIVIDTAPTGHTLRLLQLPELLTKVTTKLISFREKIISAVTAFKSMFGGSDPGQEAAANETQDLLAKLESFQTRMARMKSSLRDADVTQFGVVTIPTQLAVEESKRLLSSLHSEGIHIGGIIVNQVS